MKKIIYLGMDNKPHEVYETAHVQNSKVVYQYENNAGRRVMLRATKDNGAYYPPVDFRQLPNHNMPICKAGELYPIDILGQGYIDILGQGYSGHHFEPAEV